MEAADREYQEELAREEEKLGREHLKDIARVKEEAAAAADREHQDEIA